MPDQSPEEWYRNLKPVTRGYLTTCCIITILVQMELLPAGLLILDWQGVTGRLEVWRLLTNFCFFGGFGLPFVFSMFFIIRYGEQLELKRFEGRTADMLWFMAFSGAVMLALSFVGVVGPQHSQVMSTSMLAAIVYLWSREYSEQTISIFGLFNVQAFYFPWVLCAIHVLMGGTPHADLLGIFGGHVYYFLEDVQGVRLKAPSVLADALDAPPTGAARQAQQNRNAFGGHAWGGAGRRLVD